MDEPGFALAMVAMTTELERGRVRGNKKKKGYYQILWGFQVGNRVMGKGFR
jgi:hypothetical protein